MGRNPRYGLLEIIKTIPGYDPYYGAEEYFFDVEEAQRRIDFFKDYLVHTKAEWADRPLELRDWQRAVVANLFGWKHKETKYRRYREALIYVPRKNGKTTLCAGICLCMLYCDGEKGAEIYSAAAEKGQAKIVFDIAKDMVKRNPELAAASETFKNMVRLPGLNSTFVPISKDADTKYGFNLHGCAFDELHVQKNSYLVDVLQTSTAARRQPLIVYLTTADFARESICNDKYDQACKVRDQVIDNPRILPVIYEAGQDDDWNLVSTWRKANPNYGISPTEDYFKGEYQHAKESPGFQNTFMRLHLNIQTGQEKRWFPMDKWNKCKGRVGQASLVGQKCFGGLDLGSVSDLCAFALFFPEQLALLSWHWVPKEQALKRAEKNRGLYLKWAEQGFMTITPGDVADYDVIRVDMNRIRQDYLIKSVGVDMWNAGKLVTELTDQDQFDMIPYSQQYKAMTTPCKELERMILSETLDHGDNKVLTWCASNVTLEIDPHENYKPSKKRSGDKIDGIVAAIMAIGVSLADADAGPSVYEEQGITFL